MGDQRPDGPVEDSSDLAQPWNEAIVDFKENTGEDSNLPQFTNLGQAMREAEAQ